VVDLYGRTERFDVIAITDHILMTRDLLARAGRLASLGYRQFSVTPDRFQAYLEEIDTEARRAKRHMACCDSQRRDRRITSAARRTHVIGLNLTQYISADQPAEEILKEIRRQGALSIACHPHHRTTRRVEIGTCYLWDHRKRLVDLVDVWEAANRDDLFSVTSLKHYPYVASSDFHKRKHLYSWKTLLRCEKNWEAIAHALRANVDVALTLYRNGSWAA
jgi:predicted metal-dependent phosphoesterase TrpH